MKNIYYILTTERFMREYENKEDALADFKFWKTNACKHLRLERADRKWGTARVIKEQDNIWG